MKRRVTGFAIGLICMLSLSQGLSSSPPFPILVWYGPSPSPIVKQDLLNIRSIGFNQCFLDAGSYEQNLQILQIADSIGLSLFITDETLSRYRNGQDSSFFNIDSVTQLYKNQESFAGYFLQDKPGLAAIAGLSQLTHHFSDTDPDLDYFVQGQPNYATPARLDTSDYQAYLEGYLHDLKPKFLAVEHLALVDDSIRPEFFNNLQVLAKLSKENDTPFWSYVLVVPFGPHPHVTHAHVRVQLYSGLAYGARGVQYFSYRPPAQSSNRHGIAMLDDEGDVTQSYIYSRDINQELNALAPVLLDLTPTGVYFSEPNSFGVPELVPGLPVTKVDSPVILTGFFTGTNGRQYVMFVNTDFNYGKRPAVHFSKHVKSVVEVPKNQMPPLEYTWPKKDGNEKSAYILLKAGDGRLFEITEY